MPLFTTIGNGKKYAGTLRPGLIVAALCGLVASGNGLARGQAPEPGQAPPTVQKPQGTGETDAITFVKWAEPKEHAYTVSLPRGWNVQSALVRVGPLDVRRFLQIRSPEDNMTVIMGDVTLPTFATPTPNETRLGHGEGYTDMLYGGFQRTFLHYMSGNEFSRWYLQNRLRFAVDDLQLIGEKPLPELSQKLTQAANQGGGGANRSHVNVSVGATAFAGRAKDTGKMVRGLMLTSTRLLYGDNPNLGGTWTASINIIGCQDDEEKAAHLRTAYAIFLRMQQTMADDPTWAAKEMKRGNAFTAAVLKKQADEQKARLADAKKHAPSAPRYVAVGGGSGSSSMAAYWRNNARRAESQHQFINYLRDEKDVFLSNGERVTVSDK